MDRAGMLLFTLLLISASCSSTVEARFTRYWAQFYETIPLDDSHIFHCLTQDPVPNKGDGYAKHNTVVHTSQGYQLGSVGGMYFFHSKDIIEDIVTITFSEDLAGIWCGSSLNLRGRWRMNPDGSADIDNEELSIVGGQNGFRGASGSVYYKKVASKPNTVFLVTCDIYVDDLRYYMPKTRVDLDTQFKSLSTPVKIRPQFVEADVTAETTSDVLKQVVVGPPS